MNTLSFASQRASALAVAALVALSFGLSGCKGSTGATGASAAAQQPTGTVQGLLTDAVTKQPIVGAVVDIGVVNGKATTNVDGQFTMTNVVVPVDANNAAIAGTYYATINMNSVTSPVNMTSTATTVRYPNFSYRNIPVTFTNLYQSAGSAVTATPVTGLIATVNVSVGKLDAGITGVVADSGGVPLGAGLTVNLVSKTTAAATSGSSTGTGAAGAGTGGLTNIVATATTTAGGAFTFTNVEANQTFGVTAWDAGHTVQDCGTESVTAPTDGQTLALSVTKTVATSFANTCGGLNPVVGTVQVYSTNTLAPNLISVTPMNGTDIAPASGVSVVYTFNAAIDTTQPAAQTTASTTGGTALTPSLYSAISVNYMGAKASNIPYSLAWNAAGTALTVTIPTLAPSSKYQVTLPVGTLVSTNGVIATDTGLMATVNFTTNGAVQPAAVGAVNVLTNNIDYNAGAVALQWAPVSGAKTYHVYASANYLGMTGSPMFVGSSVGNIPTFSVNLYNALNPVYVMNGGVAPAVAPTFDYGPSAVTYAFTVKSVSADNIESAASAAVSVADNVKPAVTTVGPLATGVQVYNITFSEPVDITSVAAAATATGAGNLTVPPTVSSVSFVGAAGASTTLRVTLSAATVAGDAGVVGPPVQAANTLTISGVKDIAGNVMAPVTLAF